MSDFFNFKGRTFKRNLDIQLRLVRSFEQFDFEKLTGMGEYVRAVYSRSTYADPDYVDSVVHLIESRIESITAYSQNPLNFLDEKSLDIYV